MQVFQVAVDSVYRKDMAFTPDGRFLAVAAKTFTLLDTAGVAHRAFPDIGHMYYGFAFVRGGAGVAHVALGGVITVLDLATGETRTRKIDKGTSTAVAADPRTDSFFASAYVFGGKATLRLLSSDDLSERAAFATLNDHVERLAISADGKWLAGGSGWVTLRTWSVGGSKLPARAAATIKRDVVTDSFALSADGSRLAGASSRGLTVWDSASGSEVFRSGKHRRGVTAVACHPTKPVIVSGDNAGQVFVWDHTGRVLTRYDWDLKHVIGLTFDPEGLRCAAIGGDGTVVVWDVDP